ncbi:FAD-dependent monooxygenase [Tenacibaculum sp. AHE15PA]|uniref:FAD-dependent monooxygenase n=1 Tax=unclassified Tenacibaculum TaxID=2635139 RepID=UPI001C4F424F|nr:MULTISPECIES: NAD(P)/FAD-dependent oxidoreductase [unclassified Tenacibaculum]QXP73709.1 FAD-dependent monooxygenase [Tenacibaculum sp. AHE14PA]QXP75924.1 FAD-dependent monooxygenase [Tenacibaculum sp. AHE15PA]
MKADKNTTSSFTICKECQGFGKRNKRIRKNVKLRYQTASAAYEKTDKQGASPVRPKAVQYSCLKCKGSGLLEADKHPIADTENYPHLAIIGGGIGGVALAVACLHRQIPFTLYERDDSFNSRSQGYGLTLQQASNAIKGLGIFKLKEGVVSTKHVVHNPEGKVIGEWGMRKWMDSEVKTSPKRTNVHIARQSLRFELLEQLGDHKSVKWGHQLINFNDSDDEFIELSFKVDGKIKKTKADLVIGADGIRSSVRKLLIGDDITPLRYLGCIVILGICPLKDIKNIDSSLLDSATVFQTANGNERIYMMPFTSEAIMWQLSFPMSEEAAKQLSKKGPKALKEEACRRTPWHNPIPQILEATDESNISGYPVYDRELLKPDLLSEEKKVTLIGDAAHPMSPFKGQGANQALLDALALARGISKGCRPLSEWRKIGIRESVLTAFETEMLVRSAPKVKGSAEAVKFLHSDAVLQEANEPRGRPLNRK